MWKKNRATRAARSYEQVRPSSAKQQREITTFTVLMNPFIFSSVYLLIQLQGSSLALSNVNKMG